MSLKLKVGPNLLTINQGYSLLVTDPDGQIPWPSKCGFFVRDTRVLSSWSIYANGYSWDLLNSGAITYFAGQVFMTNPGIVTEDGTIAERTLLLQLGRSIDEGGIHEDIDLTNHGRKPVKFNLEIAIRCDFADILEIKGEHLVRRGRITTVWAEDMATLTTEYRDRDFVRELVVSRQRNTSPCVYANGRISLEVAIEPGETWHTCLEYSVTAGERRHTAPKACIAHAPTSQLAEPLEKWRAAVLKLASSNEEFENLYRQAVEDMAGLRLPVDGTHHLEFTPAAGIPWFVALFGRDSLIAALQNAHIYPDFVRGALDVLGRYQATEWDDYRDAEPGKIMHELRTGELAHFKLIPHTPYYGTADATPLYLVALHTAWRCTGDRQLVERHLGTAERCLDWIDLYGDRDGDGFQEYQTRSSAGYENQGWKDAGDAVLYPDGSLVKGPKALCELQGYVYDAWTRMAEVYEALGQGARAEELRAKAENPVRPVQRRVLGRGQRVLRLLPRRRQKAGADRGLEPGPLPVEPDRAEGARAPRRRAAAAARHVERLGDPHIVARPPVLQSDVLSERVGVAARQRHDRDRLQAVRLCRARRRGWRTRSATPAAISRSTRCPSSMPGSNATTPISRCNTPTPTCRRPGPRARCSRCCRRCWASSRTRPAGKLYLDPALPDWLPDLVLSDMRLGKQSFDLRFWRDGQETRFEVLKGDAQAIERRSLAQSLRHD